MKTNYSRRELYALGEPIGESSTYELAGRRVYGGGGGGLGGLVGGVADALGGAVDAVGDIGQGAIDTVKDAGSQLDDAVNDLPGGWALPIAAAGAYYGMPVGVEGSAGITGLGDAAAWDAATADMAAGGLDPYEIYGSGASQWGGGGDYMDLGAVSGTDLGGAGGSPASWGAGAGGAGLGSAASKLLGTSLTGNPGGLTLGGGLLGGAGLMALLNYMKSDSSRYGVPGRQDNVGPMSQFKYNPAAFRATTPNPADFRPVGAPTARVGYAEGGMAHGGISNLGGYSDGGRMLKGPGDGMSDSIPAKIGHKQPARLADGEFVVPADVVSHLGNGSTDAGAKQLYKMMDKVRQARTGRKAQGKEIKADKYLPK